jgi:hypothetical protein
VLALVANAATLAGFDHHIVQHILESKEERSSDGTLSDLGANACKMDVSKKITTN